MATPDQKSPNVLLQNLCCRILGRSEADVAQQFQYAVRVIGSNFAPTVERDEFLVAEKIKKELIRQRREADAALFSELHRKLHSQGVLKNKWSILYLLLSLSEDPRKQPNKVSSYAALFAQALPRDAHSTPYYYARPQTLPLNYQDRGTQSAQSSGSVGSSGISSIGVYALNGPTPPPQSLLPGQPHHTPGVGDCLRQQLGSRLAWTLTANQPSSQTTTSKGLPNTVSRNVTRPRREGDASGAGEVTEAALVRDIVYVFQGIDGKHVKMDSVENRYKVEAKANLSKSLRDTTVRLAELGWLHNKIRKYTDQRSLDRSFGLVGQSFCAALHQELKEYYRLLSVLHSQFFVASDPAVKTDRLWQDKYTLRRSMIPSFITMDQSRKVLLIGKSINFLHQVCHDQTPTTKMIAVTKSADSPQDAADLFTDLENAFRGKIDAAYFETSKYLLDVLNKKYSLLDHMQAVRRYLLLGQGDFIRHLMDLLKPELVRPATTLYQHNLTGILETAVRATNAQFDSPEILKRLDVRLLEVSPGDTGWDVFSLDYHVDGPIATVFTRECMSHYLRVFNFLWRAKRMEYILTDIRKGHMCNAKLLRNMPEFSGVLHHCHILASEMVHFIHQMQYYITFEVLECSWDELWNKVQQAQDLDHIIAAHEVFLDTIISRCLLDADSRALLNQLRAVFDQIIELQNTQDAIYRAALEELQRRLQFEEKKKQNEVEGRWGVTAAEEEEENRRIQEFRESIPKMCSQLRILAHFYQGVVQQFLVLLTTSSDESLRFLSFRLDFNEHYEAREPRLRVSLGSRGRRGSHA
ncbi:gamma-tubulin complex component 3 isoform X5 [Panthera tigris]|uniref:gamma-tubulin complex component 3 isoform X5 n=1 Tax=Panthera leo TaxID=9689 RepID=UPI001C6A0C3A|nr:gamma-tubulin complex component 3 isoform X5 [Panthera leo]XP_042836309.1 gamma-tubulin complex component 3 isoform X5 [Panthera tigris]XP_049503197.1 gamma-tubulin complex component 3 isoform X2 [Panthera uncia]